MTEVAGYRGYITSRVFQGFRAPQHIQNLVIRDYCQRKGLLYLLSVVEHIMPNCSMIMRQVIKDLPNLKGVVFYSVFQLPEDDDLRQWVYSEVLKSGRELRTAVEGIVIRTQRDVEVVEDTWMVQKTLARHVSAIAGV